MRKLLIGLTVLVLGVAFVLPAAAQKPRAAAESRVIWTVPAFVELKVTEDSYTFPELQPGIDEFFVDDVLSLCINTNASWSLAITVKGDGADHLLVLPAKTSGRGYAYFPVDYKLIHLRDMAPGTYNVTVIYTVTAE
ncbi:MAG TPA: hypothetical protein ENF46_01350 [Candidatus Acetothermia bacterium]|nr:hypothetical protein [Candidatus Acetothermia bacterium]